MLYKLYTSLRELDLEKFLIGKSETEEEEKLYTTLNTIKMIINILEGQGRFSNISEKNEIIYLTDVCLLLDSVIEQLNIVESIGKCSYTNALLEYVDQLNLERLKNKKD